MKTEDTKYTSELPKQGQITVTSPLLPPLEELQPYLEQIWANKWVTNMGPFHQKLEEELASYLDVEYISLFTNGTLPLITALQALDIQGEVITTPFSFVATSHAIWWNKLKPVFVDVDPTTGNLDPNKTEEAITDKTTAIMPAHVYGIPCETATIENIAKRHNLKVIYDAAHAFGVKRNGETILNAGDISTLSFHATKTYNTIEGGALICHSKAMKEKIDHLKNFGFEDEVTVVAPGINSKLDEIRSAIGLINLKHVDKAIEHRKYVAKTYIQELANVNGIKVWQPLIDAKEKGTTLNYTYFPILVDEKKYDETRDELYKRMKTNNVLGRRYFYPLITSFEPYRDYPSAKKENLPIANDLADHILCLPIHPSLTNEDVERVINLIRR